MDESKITYSIKLIDDKGESTGSKDLTLNTNRLSYGNKLRLKEKIDSLNFVKFDAKKLSSKSEEAKEGAIESMDVVQMQKAEVEVINELTKIVWGITDISLDNIVAADFDFLLSKVEELDILGTKEDADNAKKKMQERQALKEDSNISQ